MLKLSHCIGICFLSLFTPPFPCAHAEQADAPTVAITDPKFSEFCDALQKQVKENSPDYGAAVLCVLEATDADERAIDKWMRAAAKQGNAAAERWLVTMELAEVPKDRLLAPEIRTAYQRLAKIADKGYVPAMLDATVCLRRGIGTQQDEAAANKKLMEACRGGNFLARAQWLVDTGRMNFISCTAKPEVASEIKRGNHIVMFRLSTLTSVPREKVEWLKKAAESGSADAYFALSAINSAQKPKESRVLLEEAVRLHNTDAFYVMGMGLLDTEAKTPSLREAGIEPNPKRGILLLKAAAALGHLRAAHTLGRAYYKGLAGLPEDKQRAYAYFNDPKLRHAAVMVASRAHMLLRGEGVKQDTAEGIKLLTDAAEVGSPQAALMLAREYFTGEYVKADARQATQLLSDAAVAGVPAAYVFLAYVYAKGGENLSSDAAQSRAYLRLAAMDMGDKAKQLYDDLMINGWISEL